MHILKNDLKFYFFDFFSFIGGGITPHDAQRFLLALHLGTVSGGAWRTVWLTGIELGRPHARPQLKIL